MDCVCAAGRLLSVTVGTVVDATVVDGTVVTESFCCERRRRSAVSVVSVASVVVDVSVVDVSVVVAVAVAVSGDVLASTGVDVPLPASTGVESLPVLAARAELRELEELASPEAPPPHAARAAAHRTARPTDREAGSGRWEVAVTETLDAIKRSLNSRQGARSG